MLIGVAAGIALVLALGTDTLVMSISIGVLQPNTKYKIALVFALAEGLMPTIGLLIGRVAGVWTGYLGRFVGGSLLLAVSVWFVFFDDDADGSMAKFGPNLAGWALLFTALSISLDELAVGFSIGLIGVPIVLTLFLIVVQALFFTCIGIAFGRRIKSFAGEWVEKAAGIVLGLLGLWLILNPFI